MQFRVADSHKFSAEQLLAMASSPSAVPIPGVSMNKPTIDAEEPLRAELKSFLKAVRQRSQPEVTLEDGRRALETALNILSAIGEHAKAANLQSL